MYPTPPPAPGAEPCSTPHTAATRARQGKVIGLIPATAAACIGGPTLNCVLAAELIVPVIANDMA